MRNNIKLGTALVTTMSFGAVATAKDVDTSSNNSNDTKVQSPIVQGEGKCASGKFGSLKKFGVVKIHSDPQGKLVRERDGKCGVNANGDKPYSSQLGKCSSGVCGQ